jgi:hypothetical protein
MGKNQIAIATLLVVIFAAAGFMFWGSWNAASEGFASPQWTEDSESAKASRSARRQRESSDDLETSSKPATFPSTEPTVGESDASVDDVDARLLEHIEVRYRARGDLAAGVRVQLLTSMDLARQDATEIDPYWVQTEPVPSSIGELRTTDDQGRIRFDRRRIEVAALRAVTETHVGFSLLDARESTSPRHPFQFELHPLREIPVRVLTHDGDPAPDVLVGVLGDDPRHPNATGLVRQAKYTDADGRALIRPLVPLRESHRSPNGGCVWVVGLFAEPVFQNVFFEGDAAEEVVMTLPPCGSVRVDVRTPPGESLAAGLRHMRLFRRNVRSNKILNRSMLRLRHDPTTGAARFFPVGLNMSFAATIVGSDQDSFRGGHVFGDGPVVSGEMVEAVIELKNDATRVRGRLVDVDRQPIVDAEIGIQQTTRQPNDSFSLRIGRARTDGDGIFELRTSARLGKADWPLLDRDNPDRFIVLTVLGSQPRRAALLSDLENPGAGVIEIGDVVVRDVPLVVRGRFLGARPGEVSSRDLVLEKELTDGTWRRIDLSSPSDWRSPVSLDNTFAMRSFAFVRDDAPTLRLRITAKAFPEQEVSFQLGQGDLEIKLEPQARVVGQFLVPEDSHGEKLLAVIQPRQVEIESQSRPYPHDPVTADGRFEIVGLAPGDFSLALDCGNREFDAWPIRDISLIAGQELDVGSIDLRSRFRRVEVVPVRPDGTTIDAGAIIQVGVGEDLRRTWNNVFAPRGPLVFHDFRESIPSAIHIDGFRSQKPLLRPGRNVLNMAHPITVEVDFKRPEVYPRNGIFLALMFHHTEDILQSIQAQPRPDRSGFTVNLNKPGTYRVEFGAMNAPKSPPQVLGTFPFVDGPGQRIACTMTPKQVAELKAQVE